MRIFTYILLCTLCCCSYVSNTENSEFDSYFDETRKKIDFNSQNSFKVDEYEDDKLTSTYTFKNGLLIESVIYNIQTNTQEYVSHFFYNTNGDLVRIEEIKKDDNYKYIYFYNKEFLVRSVTHNLETGKDEKIINYKYGEFGDVVSQEAELGENISDIQRPTRADIKWQFEFLDSRGVNFPFGGKTLLFSEAKDILNMLSLAEDSDHIKKKVKTKANKKTLSFVGLNDYFNFEPSYITRFFSKFDDNVIKNYELALIDGFPTKEAFDSKKGTLTREYIYINRRISKIIYSFTNSDNPRTFTRRFEYHKLAAE